jgi:hypothetical protein
VLTCAGDALAMVATIGSFISGGSFPYRYGFGDCQVVNNTPIKYLERLKPYIIHFDTCLKQLY